MLGRASIDSSSFVGCCHWRPTAAIAYLSHPLFQYFSWCEEQMRAASIRPRHLLYSLLEKSSISHTIVCVLDGGCHGGDNRR